MSTITFSIEEKKTIEKLFGQPLEEITKEGFKKIKRQLMAKYHPDKFEHFEDEIVREMATEKFQKIETLAKKIERLFEGDASLSLEEKIKHEQAIFAFDKLKIEIITQDKDLKYDLFGSFYRWLQFGERFKIPNTNAYIIMKEDHRGTGIGYMETIKIYLTFSQEDAIEDIVNWFFQTLTGRAKSLLIHNNRVEVEPNAMVLAIQKKSFKSIGPA